MEHAALAHDAQHQEVVQVEGVLELVMEDPGRLIRGQHVLGIGIDPDPRELRQKTQRDEQAERDDPLGMGDGEFGQGIFHIRSFLRVRVA